MTTFILQITSAENEKMKKNKKTIIAMQVCMVLHTHISRHRDAIQDDGDRILSGPS